MPSQFVIIYKSRKSAYFTGCFMYISEFCCIPKFTSIFIYGYLHFHQLMKVEVLQFESVTRLFNIYSRLKLNSKKTEIMIIAKKFHINAHFSLNMRSFERIIYNDKYLVVQLFYINASFPTSCEQNNLDQAARQHFKKIFWIGLQKQTLDLSSSQRYSFESSYSLKEKVCLLRFF